MKRCDKCYMDPCICGKMYEKLSSSQLFELIKNLKDVLDKRHVPGINIEISGGDIVDPDTSITLEGVLKKANLTNDKLLQYSKYFADAKDMFDDMKDKADKIRSVFPYQSVYICAMFDWFDQLSLRQHILNSVLKYVNDMNFGGMSVHLSKMDTMYNRISGDIYNYISGLYSVDMNECTEDMYLYITCWKTLYKLTCCINSESLFKDENPDKNFKHLLIMLMHLLTHYTKEDVEKINQAIIDKKKINYKPYFMVEQADIILTKYLLSEPYSQLARIVC